MDEEYNDNEVSDTGEDMLDILLEMASAESEVDENNDNIEGSSQINIPPSSLTTVNTDQTDHEPVTATCPTFKSEVKKETETQSQQKLEKVKQRKETQEQAVQKLGKTLATQESCDRRVLAVRKLEEVDLFTPKDLRLKKAENLSAEELFGQESDDDGFELEDKVPLVESGKEIQRIMESRPLDVPSSSFYDSSKTVKNKWNSCTSIRTAHKLRTDKYIKDPVFDMRIVNPKVSMDWLKNASGGKEKLPLIHCAKHQVRLDKQMTNWITMAAIISKTETKRSKQSDKEYIIFKLSDMVYLDKEVTLFLFGKSYQDHWKHPVGTVIGLMNPSFMKSDKGNPNNVVTLSINDSSQLLVVGTSSDFGTCSGVTKNGKKCQKVINKSQCDRCVYHSFTAHKKALHRRPEINTSSTGSRAPDSVQSKMSGLSNGKSSDVIFYQGKTYSNKSASSKATLSGVLKKSAQKGNLESTMRMYSIRPEDQQRIEAVKQEVKSKAEKHLEDLISRPTNGSQHMIRHLINKEMKVKQAESGVKVKSMTAAELIQQSKKQLQEKQLERTAKLQKQQCEKNENIVNLDIPVHSAPIKMNSLDYSKLRAAKLIKAKGGIKKQDVNAVKKKLTSHQIEQVKRKMDEINSSLDITADSSTSESPSRQKKSRYIGNIDINSEEFKRISSAKSLYRDLTEQIIDERHEQYFTSAEQREGYSEKLLNTHKVDATVYTCHDCNYTDWKLSERCKKENHRTKTVKAQRRYFKCNGCSERTITFHKLPASNCRKCGVHNFSKAGMIRDKKVKLAGQELSLRGNEETHLGSFTSNVSFNTS